MSGMARTDAIRISGARDRGGQQPAVSWHSTTAGRRHRIALWVQASWVQAGFSVGDYVSGGSSSWLGRSKLAESREASLEGTLIWIPLNSRLGFATS